MPVCAEVVGIGETLEKRRSLLLAHAHSRGNGGWGLLLVAHARQTFQQCALAGWQIVQPALIERRDPVEQQVELILHAGDRLVGDQLVEHHRQPWVSPRHAVERLQARAHVVQHFENVRAFFPFEIQADDFNRVLEAQVLQDLNVEEVIEWLSHVGDTVEMQRCGGQQQAAVVGHEKFAQGGDIALVADLPGKDLAQIFEHDEQGSATPAILFADCGYQRVGNLGVVFFGLYCGEQLRPQRLVFKDFLQYPAHADQEIGEGQRSVRFLWEPDDYNTCAQRFVGLNGVFNAREQVSLADPARTDE